MKYLKYVLFVFLVFISFNVSAAEFNMNSYTSATLGGTKNRYRGTEIDNSGTANTYTFGTQYNGRLSIIETYFDYPFSANVTYRLTYNMNTEDFRNTFAARYWWDCDHEMNATNQHLGTLTFVSMKKVQFTFTPSDATTCIRVMIGSSNASSSAITGVSNWRLNNITIYDPEFQSGSGGGQGTSTPTPTPVATPNASNQDIINNNNQNTQDIINNNNQNTQDIIENNNQNTEIINDSLNSNCKSGPQQFSKEYNITFNKSLSDTGAEIISGGYITTYFNVLPSTEYTIDTGSTTNRYYCLYNGNKTVISCAITGRTTTFTTNSNTRYIRVSMSNNSNLKITGPVCNNWEQEGLKDINDTLKDSSIDDKTGFFTDFDDDDHGLTSIITIPLSTIQQLTSTSCLPLNLPIPFTNGSVSLPCMTEVYQNNVPSIFSIWQIVSFGIISYLICLDIFKIVKGFKDPNEDKIEVLDL